MNKLWIALLPVSLLAQDRITATFSDPNRPGTVRINTVEGSITVTGHAGKDVIVENSRGSRDRDKEATGGMRRIITAGGGVEVQEEGNVMKINMDPSRGGGSLVVQVPMKTTLTVKAVNGGVSIENIQGEVEATSINGKVTLKNINGSVIANSHNGKIEAVLTGVTPGKPMSFISMNGTIDVTLPAATKANLRMRAENADVFSDFDVTLRGDQTQTKTDVDGDRRRWRSDSFTLGTINGGGPEIRLESRNAKIYVRKGQ